LSIPARTKPCTWSASAAAWKRSSPMACLPEPRRAKPRWRRTLGRVNPWVLVTPHAGFGAMYGGRDSRALFSTGSYG
jgi:hypothetical protein